MEKMFLLTRFLLPLFTLSLLTSCSKENLTEKTQEISHTSSKTYTHDNLILRYPHHWELVYDDSPSLYADRGISFNTSEISGVSIFIYKDSTINLTEITDHYERSLNLKSDEHIKNYQRQFIEINSIKGERLIWNHIMFDSTKVEVTVLPVDSADTRTFVVFHLLDEDIEKESPNLIPFVKGILF